MDEAAKERWRREIRREMLRWGSGERCTACGEWVGHWSGGGAVDAFGERRPPCPTVPLDIYLQEVRPNCVTVRRHWIGDAIRAAEKKRARPC